MLRDFHITVIDIASMVAAFSNITLVILLCWPKCCRRPYVSNYRGRIIAARFPPAVSWRRRPHQEFKRHEVRVVQRVVLSCLLLVCKGPKERSFVPASVRHVWQRLLGDGLEPRPVGVGKGHGEFHISFIIALRAPQTDHLPAPRGSCRANRPG
jgi:hypothetical protein